MGVVPNIQSRLYSIASASETDRVHITTQRSSTSLIGYTAIINDHCCCKIQGDQYDQVSLVVGVVEEGSSKDGRKGSKDEVRRENILSRGKTRKKTFSFQLRKGSRDEVGRKGSNEVGPPWKGLCTGQLLTAEVSRSKTEVVLLEFL